MGYMAKYNMKFNLREVHVLTQEGFQHTTVDMWRKFCRHVVDIENYHFDKDGLVVDMVDEIILNMAVMRWRMKMRMTCWMRMTDT